MQPERSPGGGLEEYYCAHARDREPLLEGHPGNARRKAALAEIRARLDARAAKGHFRLARFLGYMGPDSTLAAWRTLHGDLSGIDPGLARIAASEHNLARSDLWGAMKTGSDMLPHLEPLHGLLARKRSDALMEMREGVKESLGHVGGHFRPDPAMRKSIANMARFSSGDDEDVTLMLIEEIYIRRGHLGEACDICEDILEFDGFDFHRTAGSTLFEDIMIEVLCALSGRGKRGGALAGRCRSLLERRSDLLGLGIRPRHGDTDAPRALVEFAHNISLRAGILPAEEMGRRIAENYPKSHRFLGLDNPSTLRDLVKRGSPLASSLSVFAGQQELNATMKVPYAGGNALMPLETALGEMDLGGAGPAALKKWRKGILGEQVWESLFEMEMYLRLRRVGASVEVDKKVGKKKAGKKDHRKKVDLEFNGTYAEIYSPLARQFTSLEDSRLDFMRGVLAKGQLGSVGRRETIMIVECPIDAFCDALGHEKRVRRLLGRSGQPGGAFFVLGVAYPQRMHKFLPNPRAIAPIPDATVDLVGAALDFDLQPPLPEGSPPLPGMW